MNRVNQKLACAILWHGTWNSIDNINRKTSSPRIHCRLNCNSLYSHICALFLCQYRNRPASSDGMNTSHHVNEPLLHLLPSLFFLSPPVILPILFDDAFKINIHTSHNVWHLWQMWSCMTNERWANSLCVCVCAPFDGLQYWLTFEHCIQRHVNGCPFICTSHSWLKFSAMRCVRIYSVMTSLGG